MKKIIFLILLACSHSVFADPTKVGNGDDGSDLEKLQKVESGILISTRDRAASQMEEMKIRSIKGLGLLIDEIRKADLYLVSQNDSNPKGFDRGLEVSADGKFVYARTMARPHAPVRFFPAALMLSEDQLVRLHIHEALHRSLPESIRENESIVTDITLALTTPGTSRDQVEATMARYLPVEPSPPAVVEGGSSSLGISSLSTLKVEPTERLKKPSTFTYSYRAFEMKTEEKELVPLRSLHRIDSFLHPFGGPTDAFGLGLSFSYLSLQDKSYMGPLQVSARLLVATWRGFDIETFGEMSMLTLSSEELKALPEMRDNVTFGISMRKEGEIAYMENSLAYTLGTERSFQLGQVAYRKTYAPVAQAKISAGARYEAFFAGVQADFLLTESGVVASESGSFQSESERVRLVKFGPEVGFARGGLRWSLFAHGVVDGTPNYNLTDVANLMGHGVGQGYAGSSFSYQF